jgi:hypothetical protein
MDDEDFSEAERERKRLLRGSYVQSGIEMSGKHKRWLKGRKAAEEAAEAGASYRAEMSGERLPSYPGFAPELATGSPQVCNCSFSTEKKANRTWRMWQTWATMKSPQLKEKSRCTPSNERNGT